MNHLWDNSESGFEAFHKANPHVYELFKRFAAEARAAGHKRYAASTIVEMIRWHTTVTTKGGGFKINNYYRKPYAKMLVRDDPGFAGFFEFREGKGAA